MKKVRIKKELPFHLMLLPAVVLIGIFSYGSMFGLVMAFQKFNPFKGFIHSMWVGLENFKYVFDMPDFINVIWNTVYIAGFKIIIGLLSSLILALLINEVKNKYFSKFVQTSIFIPFFLSWAILGGVFSELLSLKGPINNVLEMLGMERVIFLASNDHFPWILILTDVWKGVGYNMIVFLAAITGVNPSLYEAARVDGASKLRQTWHITLPSIRPIVILIGTLSLGAILNAGFDQVLMLYSPIVYESGDVIDTFVYRIGIFNRQYSPAAAIGFFKSFVSFGFVSISYYLAYKFSDYRIF